MCIIIHDLCLLTLQTVDLVSDGSKIPVTNENKKEYLNALANYRLATKVKSEVEAFLKGVNEMVPEELLTIFDENELEVRSHEFLRAKIFSLKSLLRHRAFL